MTKQSPVALAILSFLLVSITAPSHAQFPTTRGRDSTVGVRPVPDARRTANPDIRDVQALANDLFRSVEPNRKENAYYPDFVRNNIGWLYAQLNRKTISGPHLTLEPYVRNRNNQLMSVGMDGSSKFFQLHAARLWYWVRVEDGMETGYTKVQKDSFALFLTHEALHLQRDDFPVPGSVDEELRVHHLVAMNGTRHMRAAGVQLQKDLVDDDNVFRSCGYELPCPAARRLIAQRLAQIY